METNSILTNLRSLSPQEQELLEQYRLAKAAYDNSSDDRKLTRSLNYALSEAENICRIAVDDLEQAKFKVFTTKIYKDAIKNAYNVSDVVTSRIYEDFTLARQNCRASFKPQNYLDAESQE